MAEDNKIKCPVCKEEVEIKQIKVKEKVMYKYISFSKIVGICPNCTSEIHLPELDECITNIQSLNKTYVTAANKYQNITDVSKDNDFSKDWDTIDFTTLAFETTDSGEVQSNLRYNGTLVKVDLGYDVVTLDPIYNPELDNIKEMIMDEEGPYYGGYNFKTYALVSGEYKEICAMLWLDISGNISGILFNKDDVNSYRYGKQKAKDKAIIV